MTIGNDLGITLPTPGGSDVWGALLNAQIQKIIDAVQANVPVGSITWNAEVGINSQKLSGVDQVQLETVASTPSGVSAAGTVYFDGTEFYLIDGAGNSIQITNSGNPAATGLEVNGIYGSGYGASDVQINWDAVDSEYEFFDGASSYASVKMGEIILPSNGYETTISPNAAASDDYTITLPADAPSTWSVMSMGTSGNIAVQNDLSTLDVEFNDVTLAGDLEVTAGDLDVVAGDLTISGADMKHGERTVNLSAGAITYTSTSGSGTVTVNSLTNVTLYTTASGSDIAQAFVPMHIPEGKRLTGVGVNTVSGASSSYCNVAISSNYVGTKQAVGSTGETEGSFTIVPSAGTTHYVQLRLDGNPGAAITWVVNRVWYKYDEV